MPSLEAKTRGQDTWEVPAVRTPNEPFHEGNWLRDLVGETGLSQKEFASRHDLKVGTLSQWFIQSEVRFARDKKTKLARALGMSPSEFDAFRMRARVKALKAASPELVARWAEDARRAKAVEPASVADMVEAGLPVGESDEKLKLPSGIETGSIRQYHEIPTFDVSLSAGARTDGGDAMDACGPESIDQGLFRARVAGDSMEPKYQSGCIVEFECLRVPRDDMQIGKDYYVQWSDGTATFKRLEGEDEKGPIFRAINVTRYKAAIHVAWDEVARTSVARCIIIPVD
jgi:transcriptional regulator with XRE-family HTH domain